MDYSTTITVRFTAPGLHHWPEAPDRRFYLRTLHRHLFHVEVTAPVEHHERQIEFHDLLEEAQGLFGRHKSNASCETMAHDLAAALSQQHDGVPFTVSVFEDGEVGATVVLK